MSIHELNHEEIAQFIKRVGPKRSIIVRGEMGIGKTSILNALAEDLPSHEPVYFDATTRSLADLAVPDIAGTKDYMEFKPNKMLGLHSDTPKIIVLDEITKASRSLKVGLTRFLLERAMDDWRLPEGSIVFATGNLAEEGLADTLEAHQRNRIIELHMRKPGHLEWIAWGINRGLDPTVLAWVRDNPQTMQSFRDVEKPSDNPYIFHPREQRAAFVTPRSLEAASDLMAERRYLPEHVLEAGLAGTLGAHAAADLVTWAALADQMPSIDSIKKDPEGAKIPESAAAVCMVVYRTLSLIEQEWVPQWLRYMDRLPKEVQGLFANGVMAKGYGRQLEVVRETKWTDWARANHYMFAVDQK